MAANVRRGNNTTGNRGNETRGRGGRRGQGRGGSVPLNIEIPDPALGPIPWNPTMVLPGNLERPPPLNFPTNLTITANQSYPFLMQRFREHSRVLFSTARNISSQATWCKDLAGQMRVPQLEYRSAYEGNIMRLLAYLLEHCVEIDAFTHELERMMEAIRAKVDADNARDAEFGSWGNALDMAPDLSDWETVKAAATKASVDVNAATDLWEWIWAGDDDA